MPEEEQRPTPELIDLAARQALNVTAGAHATINIVTADRGAVAGVGEHPPAHPPVPIGHRTTVVWAALSALGTLVVAWFAVR
ncbi:hypothetical protein ACIRPK_09615 [Kitasatospora sp. NPDC101801]|uniref:hypothetical protein n=1 Tax=Kitasatospora sp. NPDC101801 TaxID=3364103 RepID=UPI00380D6292